MATKALSVADVMTTDPVVLDSGATLEAADLALRSTFIKGIPVVDGQGRLVGTITHAHLAAHRFASVDRVRPETGSKPAARTEQTDQPTDRRGLDQGA
jgi:CBS-domain-containing membrane protein